jgi:hypothetical protein
MDVLDLFSGLGGFSQAFLDRGHRVLRIDNDARFQDIPHTVIMDVRHYKPDHHFDVVLASPPCTEFAPWAMPASWHPDRNPTPSLELVEEAIRVIRSARPRFWVIENVRGSVRFLRPILGRPVCRSPQYLWGEFPILYQTGMNVGKNNGRLPVGKGKETLPPGPMRPAIRSKIPLVLSMSLCLAMEAFYSTDYKNGGK